MSQPQRGPSIETCRIPAPSVTSRLQDAGSWLRFRIPSPLRAGGAAALYLVRRCLGGRVPVFRLEGPANPSGRAASLLVAGEEPWVSYLPLRFFSEPPRREMIDRVSIPSLPGLLRRLRSSVDLTIARVDRFSSRMPWARDYLHGPEWVGATLTLPEDPEAPFRRSHSLREDLRRLKKNRLEPWVSRNESDFAFFHERMYAPYTLARHGELGVVRPAHYVRQWFNRGGVLFARQNGVRLAGLIFMRFGRVFHVCVVGTIDGRYGPVRLGALAALWIFAVQHARDMGCERVVFGGSRAVLQDGSLRFKSKWGVRFDVERSSMFELLLYWNRLDGAVADFFSHTSPVFRCKTGLGGLWAVSGDRKSGVATRKSLWINGLQKLYVVDPEGRLSDPAHPDIAFLNGDISPHFFSEHGHV